LEEYEVVFYPKEKIEEYL